MADDVSGPAGSALPVGTVTFLLTDIEGSTGLWDADPDAMAAALAIHDDLVAASVARFGGNLVKTKGEGDSTFSVFADPSGAVAAADAIQAAVAAQVWPVQQPLKVRMSVTTGMAELRDGDYFGPTVNRAARIRGLATGGEILLSSSTYSLLADSALRGCTVEDRGEQELRGLQRPERVWALTPGQGGGPPGSTRTRPQRGSGASAGSKLPMLVGAGAFALIVAVGAVVVAGGDDGGENASGGPTTAAPAPSVQILEVGINKGDGTTEYEVVGRSDHVVDPPYEIRVLARDPEKEKFWWWSDPAKLTKDGGWTGKLLVDAVDTDRVRLSAVAIITPVGDEVRMGASAEAGLAGENQGELPKEIQNQLTLEGPDAEGVKATSDEFVP